MYFWKIEQLKTEMTEAPLTQKQNLSYLIAFTIVYGLALIPFGDYNKWDVLSALMMIPVSVIGVYWAYYSNGGDEGRDFLSRFFAIGWVMSVRLFVFLVPIFFVVMFALVATGLEISEESTLGDVLVIVLISVFYYWRVAIHIRQTGLRLDV